MGSVSSVKTLEEAKVTKGCLYMAMPVHEVGARCAGAVRVLTRGAVRDDAVWEV